MKSFKKHESKIKKHGEVMPYDSIYVKSKTGKRDPGADHALTP